MKSVRFSGAFGATPVTPVSRAGGTLAALGVLSLTLGAGCLVVGCTGQVDASNPNAGSGARSGTGAGTGSSAGTGAVTGGAGSGAGAAGGAGVIAGDVASAGTRPLRLLTRREYLNTVRDLLGDTSLVPDGLPSEDEDPASAFAFHTTGTVATLDATLYRDAAEALAKAALPRMNTLLPCAASATSAAAETACLNTFMTTWAVKMYRRPLAAPDVTRLTDIFTTGRTTLALNFSAAMAFLVEVVLQSPEFLYHWEVDPVAAVKEGALVKLGNYELANRLSYFVWGTMPDDVLFAAAKAGQLGDAASVEAQMRRMLKDAKAGSTIGDFFVDWMDLDLLVDKPKDLMTYPLYTDAMPTSMAGEVQNVVKAVMVEGSGHFDDLMTGTNSFVDATLAPLYGITGITGTAFKAVALDPTQRSGLFTSGGFMSLTGGSAGSDPPRRGKAVLYKLLCRTLPPPPPVVPDPRPVTPGLTTRQRFEEHSMNPCATACHNILDPLGFAFENYDGIGQYRTMDNNLPVNASVTLTLDGQPKTVSDARGMLAAMATSDEVQTCFTRQWFRYALGRMDTADDLPSVNATASTFKAASRDVRELMVGLTKSPTFRYRTPGAGEVLQ